MAFDKIQDFSDETDPVDAWGWHQDKDHIIGGSGDDELRGGEGDDEISGNDGDDFISDLTFMWTGVPPSSLFLPQAPDDEEEFFAERPANSPMALYFSGGDDRFFGNGGDDRIAGYEGDDLLDGGADDDVVWGGDGHDEVKGGLGDDRLYGNDGNDTISGGSGADLLGGGTGADTMNGGTGADTIDGGDVAADTFDGMVAAGFMTRAQANAALAALNDGDTVSYATSLAGVNVNLERATQSGGDAQGDTITGVENIDGSLSSDTLRGNDKANVLFGDRGNDLLEGRGGADTLIGGDQIDTASYESSASGVNVDLLRTTQTGGDAQGDTLREIENLRGSEFGDVLRGDDAAAGNLLTGFGGNDTLEGRGGDDRLFGHDGADTLDGGANNDLLDGGLGNDNLRGGTGFDTVTLGAWDTPPAGNGVLFIPSQVTVRLGQNGTDGTATRAEFNSQTFSFNVVETDTLRSIERVDGTNNADTFFGNELDNEFNGLQGNDTFRTDLGRDTYDGYTGIDTVDYGASSAAAGVTVSIDSGVRGTGGFAEGDLLFDIENVIGTAGNDTITGNRADNRLTGGRGDDRLNGGDGNDTLIGGAQLDIDVLTGGAGRDTFLYLSRDDSRSALATTGDAIQDFNVNDDLIDLRALDIDAADLLIRNVSSGGVNTSFVSEDANNNGVIDAGEFTLLVQIDGAGFVTAQDVLLS